MQKNAAARKNNFPAGRKINSEPKCGEHRPGEATAEPIFFLKKLFFYFS
jgi:hypothetical protein